MQDKQVVIFGLVRGYVEPKTKWRYLMIVSRNLAIRIHELKTRRRFTKVIFHEGNISTLDRWVVNFASLGGFHFVDVSETFSDQGGLLHTGSTAPLGYSLMCRFQYYGIWRYLEEFRVAVRIDEDCIVTRFPNLEGFRGFSSPAITQESHAPTNQTLLPYLETTGDAKHYNQRFPYTNVYFTEVAPWLQPDVQSWLEDIATHPDSLEMRWGDIPVLGTALNRFRQHFQDFREESNVSYFHLTHLAKVAGGSISLIRGVPEGWVPDLSNPGRTIRELFRAVRRDPKSRITRSR